MSNGTLRLVSGNLKAGEGNCVNILLATWGVGNSWDVDGTGGWERNFDESFGNCNSVWVCC